VLSAAILDFKMAAKISNFSVSILNTKGRKWYIFPSWIWVFKMAAVIALENFTIAESNVPARK
jgi:hypothetical protein